MRVLYCLLLAALCVGAALPSAHAQAGAAAGNSIYTVVVPVPDVSAAQRDAAFSTALGQVLVRAAGGQDLRSRPGYDAALEGARALVQKYQYQRAGSGVTLEVDFAPSAVQNLIEQLGATSVGARPPVLLLVRGTDGALFDQAALASLAAAAAEGGLQVTYPAAGDAPDYAKLAAADPAALAALDQRYHTGLVLLGELHRGGGADWTLVAGGQAQHWTAQGGIEDALLAAAGQNVAQRIDRELNVVGTSVSEGTLWVAGLHSAMDYANLLAALRRDPAVRGVETRAADGDGVLLAVESTVPLRGLAANLAASGRVLLQREAHAGADVTLDWVR